MQATNHGEVPATVQRVALLGGESSGKTTLAIALAQALHTRWVPEYGRQRWEELRETLGVDELVRVAQRQIEWEDEAAWAVAAAHPAARWLVCDTTPLTTLQYCLHDHGQAPPELHQMARRAYALTVLCLPDFGFVQDGARRDDAYRAAQHAWTVQQLARQGVVPLQVAGPVVDRVAQVLQALQALQPLSSLSCDLPRFAMPTSQAQTSIAATRQTMLESSHFPTSSGDPP